jgi:transcriptional antiterminator RfaH
LNPSLQPPSLPPSPPSVLIAWFCLRARPKHEHIAARHLRQLAGLEVFLPRIRFRRKTRQGVVWVTEALFPNYLFARFDWQTSLRRVHHAPGVAGVIHFGNRWPTIPDGVVDELRRRFGREELHVLSGEPEAGEPVRIAGGVFHGLQAVVAQVLPARQRVTVLLDFLGRQTTVELPLDQVLREGNVRNRMD